MNLYAFPVRRNIKYFLTLLSVFILSILLNAQIVIGSSNPDSSAVLDLVASDKGFSAPTVSLLSETDAQTIKTPKKGLIVYHDGSGILQEGFYYNSETPSSPVWARLSQYPDVKTLPSIDTSTSNTLSIGDIEVRLNVVSNNDGEGGQWLMPQIRFTKLGDGESINYATFITRNIDTRSTSGDNTEFMIYSSNTTGLGTNKFTDIHNDEQMKSGRGANDDIWIYYTDHGVYHVYNYIITTSQGRSSQLIDKY